MTETGATKSMRRSAMEERARELGTRSTRVLERWGFDRVAGGILLIVLGVLVLLLPHLIVWIVGIASILLGVLVLAQSSDQRGGAR